MLYKERAQGYATMSLAFARALRFALNNYRGEDMEGWTNYER